MLHCLKKSYSLLMLFAVSFVCCRVAEQSQWSIRRHTFHSSVKNARISRFAIDFTVKCGV
jgi:hypothetical protein